MCNCTLATSKHGELEKESTPVNILVVTSSESFISGRGVRVLYQPSEHTVTLYRLEGTRAIQMSKPSAMGYPVVNGKAIQDFTDYACKTERNTTGTIGDCERMTITSCSAGTQLVRTYTIEVSKTERGVVYTATTYRAGDKAVAATEFVENKFELFDPGSLIWSFNGGGEGPTTFYDQLQRIDLTTPEKFVRENIQDCTAAGIPVADIYNAGGGIAIGDASPTRREVHTPVRETEHSAEVSIWWPGKTIAAGAALEMGQSFLIVHTGDYYSGLRGYKKAMEHLGVVMQTDISDRSYELRWESWGWAFDWTMDLIINKLDQLKAAGVQQITLDDAWYDHAGDWQLNPEKFPNGEADMIRLVKEIHDRGMSALLWWRPCDGGRDGSALCREHPDYFVMHEDGSIAKIGGPGKKDTSDWCMTAGYILCPGSEGAVASTVDFVNRAMNVWGFDGFKGDFVWSMPKCYNPAHHHAYPEESTERQTEFYKAAHDAMVANDPDVFNMLCHCGAPQDFYGLQYMTQVITADPTSLDQTRTRLKAYKALMGDNFPISTDHCQIWYSTTVGTGGVLIEKVAFVGEEEEYYERWLKIAAREQLHKGRFVGDLYSYGFDPYETYVVEKDGVMHYAFYRDGKRYLPDGYPDIELKGLDPDKMYRIVDYVNDRVVATNLMGDNAVFSTRFSKDLLVKAVEITTPDTEAVNQDAGFTVVSAGDTSLVCDEDSVEFSFAGTAVRWYGRKSAEEGVAEVYLNGKLTATVSTGGGAEEHVCLFEALDIPPAKYKMKIVRKSGKLDVDRIAYEYAVPSPVYEKVAPNSEQIVYKGNWQVDHGDTCCAVKAMFTSETGASAEFTFQGTAVRWIGKRVLSHYAIAMVYLDGEQVDTVYNYGEDVTGQILFERTGLTPGTHTLRILQSCETIDVECLAYANETD